MKKGWLVVISLVAAIALLSAAGSVPLAGGISPALAAGTDNSQQGRISVTGQGRVSITPDMAVLRLGVEAQADTISGATSQAAEAMERILTAMEGHGVKEKDVQTFHFSISPLWRWERTAWWRLWERGEQKRTGYQVSNMVTVRIRALDQVGVIINDVVKAGGDLIRIHGVDFAMEGPVPFDQALEEAFADARAKAEKLAGLAGVTLGRVIYISEGMGQIPLIPGIWHPPAPMEVGPAGLPTPIMPGEQEVIINVQVIFAIELP
ncbi:MAG TPA: hypothetical protein DCY61_05350 [Dehalococcoidia bacterium]|nr:hypothetical protein [Dehalococcoidia bacterium]